MRWRILAIDDEEIIRRLVTLCLVTPECAVETADGGWAGIERFRTSLVRGEPFDLVITDLSMPQGGGEDVARVVKQEAPGTPVILLTAWDNSISGQDASRHVDLILDKPIRMRDLRAAVAKLLQRVSDT